ncbi:hypothetical protein ACOY8D_02595 [Enterobacter roggenkampii]|uniref:hypothetical protein n=1 Tax=Enterobacter roggenkampii TaxID=1812935 RepID=UPI003BC92C97
MSNKYEDLIKNARMNADCGEHMSPAEVTTLLNVVETTFAALAAENAGLNKFIKDDCFIYTSDDSEPRDAYDFKPETPATDAFLAEVRAQGVDSAINTVIAMMNHQHPVTSKAIDTLRVHAYQIRKGVQS